MANNYTPWKFLDEFRGNYFKGEWPTLPELVAITVKRFGDRPAFTDFEGTGGSKNTLTYAQAYEIIWAVASWLSANGLKKGDRIAVSGKNSPEWAVLFIAGLICGAVVCPIDYALREAETENLLNTAKPKFFFVDEEKYEYFSQKEEEIGSYVFSLSPKFAERYVYNLAADEEVSIEPPTEDDLAVILFTSGTTGNPKGAMLTHKNLVSDAYIAQTRMYIDQNDVFYALLPIHHAYTLQAVFIESLAIGAEIVFGKSLAVSKIMKELKEGKITMLLGVPMLFNKLLNGILAGVKKAGPLMNLGFHIMLALSGFVKKIFKVNVGKVLFAPILKKANLHSLRIAICGGGPLADSVFKIYNQMGINFVQGYGLTETSPIIALNPVDHFKIESVGQYFFPYSEMKILNPAEDGVGEVCVKGPMVFKGYYKMEEETAKVFTEDGWFKTGDLGWLDSEGYLMLAGRAKNMIVTSGGKNVYPEEIENRFQLSLSIGQITVQAYVEDAKSKSEEIEALIYPSDSVFEKLKISREGNEENPEVRNLIEAEVSEVNKVLQPYEKISKITLLHKPLEMTTTQKVKRFKK